MSKDHSTDLPTVVVFMTCGGQVGEVAASEPVRACVIDYDTDDAEAGTTVAIPQDRRATSEAAIVQSDVAVVNPERVDHIVAVVPDDIHPGGLIREEGLGRIAFVLEGGVLQNTLSDRPMHVIVVDYDVDGADAEDVCVIHNEGNDECLVARAFNEVDSAAVNRLWPVIDPTFDAPAPAVARRRARPTH